MLVQADLWVKDQQKIPVGNLKMNTRKRRLGVLFFSFNLICYS